MGRIMLMAAFMLGAAAQPQAGTVYKCTVEGRVSYGEHPCAGGATTALPAPATLADEQAAKAAAARLERDKARLARLGKERQAEAALERRAAAQAATAARAAATVRQKCERLRLKSRWADEDLARSGAKARDAARLKARRQAEALAVECPA